MNNKKWLIPSILLLSMTSSFSFANNEFNGECSSESVLVTQKSKDDTNLYMVDVSTGLPIDGTLFKDSDFNSIQGIGYNPVDGYYYGKEHSKKAKFVRIMYNGSNSYTIDRITEINANEINKNIYSGDINSEGFWYGFDGSKTFFKINLNLGANQYDVEKIKIKYSNEKVKDIAFYTDPNTGEKSDTILFGLTKGGKGEKKSPKLSKYVINPDGSISNSIIGDLGDLGLSKSDYFESAYFDDNGNLYVIHKKDGAMFKIDFSLIDLNGSKETDLSHVISFFSNSTLKGYTDAARCGKGQNSPTEEFDYGSHQNISQESDARAVYDGTSSFSLGLSVSPDSGVGEDPLNSDGVTFVNNVFYEDGIEQIKVLLTSVGDTYLSGWVDFNNNGIFENSEKIINASLLTPNMVNILSLHIPNNVANNNIKVRFRSAGNDTPLSAYGSSGVGEVEDYTLDILETSTNTVYYPSANGYATVAFEDKWPEKADYDFNDVVIKYRTSNTYTNGRLTKIDIIGELVAYGASNNNGFGFELSNFTGDQTIKVNEIDFDNVTLKINDRNYERNPDNLLIVYTVPENRFRLGRKIISPDNPNSGETVVFRIFEDIKEQLGRNDIDASCPFESTEFYRSSQVCGESGDDIVFSASIPIKTNTILEQNAPEVFKPFLYSSPNDLRYSNLDWDFWTKVYERRLEIHLKNNKPTNESFSSSLFGFENDISNGSDLYFLDENGMPWAFLFTHEWYPPKAGLSILEAYPLLTAFLNSSGVLNVDWYLTYVSEINGVISNQN